MKVHTIGVFKSRADAESAIRDIHANLMVPREEISFLYRDDREVVRERKEARDSGGSGAGTGATAGALLGGIAGFAMAVGAIPIIGPILAAGPLVAALGITGAVGTTAAGAVTGAVAGGLLGALADIGVSRDRAERYQERVRAGDVLVAVRADEHIDVRSIMLDHNAEDADVFGRRIA